jgi:hypothetical protein
MVYITHIRLSSGNTHEYITDVKWHDSATGNANQMTRQQAVNWIDQGNRLYVTDGTHTVEVGVVKANPSYLRTYADGKWTDNLLALPRF